MREIQLSVIKENINSVLNEIEKTHKISKLLKFTNPKISCGFQKTNDQKVIEALKAGHKFFGENRVQEAEKRWLRKIEKYKNLELRLIGPSKQTKLKQALETF